MNNDTNTDIEIAGTHADAKPTKRKIRRLEGVEYISVISSSSTEKTEPAVTTNK